MAVYGATTIQIGMNYVELLPDGSLTSQYLRDYGNYLGSLVCYCFLRHD